MKKFTITSIVAALCIASTYGIAGAVATGACANCHTMHNMQNGAVVDASGPYGVLLKGSCYGCHSQGMTTGTNIVNNTPQVAHTNATDLAGGNFAYILNAGAKIVDGNDSIAVANPDTVGHNVSELGNPEGIAAMFPPPGDEYAQAITSANFTCGGVYGCHGDRTAADSYSAVKGSHHFNDSMLKFGAAFSLTTQGTTTANSYRFLKGVKGAEVSDWQNADASHNEYLGATDGVEAGSASVPGNGTISGLCAECHGNFHGPRAVGSDITNTATGSPWLRHPTDIVLPATGEYASYTGAAAYKADAPVGRQAASLPDALAAPLTSVTPGTDIVMCLSCHKVHGSANADILRWNYEDISAGTGADATRCFICHTTKDTGS
ncbi:MAG: cytochrome c3 family protein [Nitrospirota bacterium]